MPRYPSRSPHADAVPASTFSTFAARLKEAQADPQFVPLHLGDTYPLPPEPARRIDLDDPSLYRYGPVAGLDALREAGAEDLRGLGLDWATPARTFVTPGATGGLDIALDITIGPGDEVLILTPTWPLIFGLVARRGAKAVQVPLSENGAIPPAAELRALLERYVTPRTAAVSFVNPSNPTGFTYGPEHLAAIAELAQAHDLWVFCDGVYADLTYDRRLKVLAALPAELEERTFVATSYSKSFGLAGQRVGLLATPPAADGFGARLLTHTCYHAAHTAQVMALAALRTDPVGARGERIELAKRGAALTQEILGGIVPFGAPAGGAFLLLDLRAKVADAAGMDALLGQALDQGVSLAPGLPFGVDFARFARLCFTAVPPDRLRVGLERLARVFSR